MTNPIRQRRSFKISPLHALPVALLFALVAVLPSPPTAGGASTILVDTLVDSSDGSCSDGSCSLRDAIAVATAGDTIQFIVNGTITLNSVLGISKSLTINGPGADKLTLDGHGAIQIINISAGSTATVSILGLSIANGSSGGSFGGGIRNQNIMGASHLVLDRMAFINNRSTGNGGAIYSNGVLTITNSRFDSNQAGSAGAIQISFSNADITGSAFINNQATGNDGGGIYTSGASGLPINVAVTNSTFTGNKAVRDGGAVYVSYDSAVAITDCSFINNTVDYGTFNSQGDGGAIYDNAALTVNRSTFIGNQAGTNSTTNNKGGAIHTSGSLDITNSTFYNNKVRAAGGALSYEGSNTARSITNTTLYGNDILGPGAGRNIYTTSYITVTVKNTLVGGPSNGVCSGSFTGSSTNNLATDGSCSGGFSSVTPAALNLAWKGTYFLPMSGSAAIDTGTNTGCPNLDQRGWPRPVDGDSAGGAICDIGAIEATPAFKELYLPILAK